MSTRTAHWNWWEVSVAELGVQAMDRTLAADATWDDVIRSGREELAVVRRYSQMQSNPNRRVLDIGCGVGRVSFALAEHFRDVVGVDISNTLIDTARAHNRMTNLRFETVDGPPLWRTSSATYDTVFANEVFYYLDWPTLTNYSRDAFRLLKNGGEYVFQVNLDSIAWKTRLSWTVRSLMYRCGIKKWRGWTNSPGFIRYFYPPQRVVPMLESLGFEDIQVRVGHSARQTWYVSRKPAAKS